MADRTPIIFGSHITNGQGLALGRVGAIVHRGNGKILILTARHIVNAAPAGELLIATSLAGRIDETLSPARSEEPFDFSDAICALQVPGDAVEIVVDPASARVGSTVENAEGLIDEQVSVVIDGKLHALGTMFAVDGRATVRDRFDQTLRKYRGAMKVDPNLPGGYRLAPGDAGAPVVDRTGQRLVGLVISSTSDRYFVAPASPFLGRHELRLFAREAAAPERPSSPGLASANASLREVGAELMAWSEELRQTPSYYGGEAIFSGTREAEPA